MNDARNENDIERMEKLHAKFLEMKAELSKFGVDIIVNEDEIIIPKTEIKAPKEILNCHNDHRIVMAMSVILSKIGGEISGVEAVRKSYPGFFGDIKKLGADICRIGSMDNWKGAPKQMDPRYIFPDAKSIIGLGFLIPRGYLRGIEEGTFFSIYEFMGYSGMIAFAASSASFIISGAFRRGP